MTLIRGLGGDNLTVVWSGLGSEGGIFAVDLQMHVCIYFPNDPLPKCVITARLSTSRHKPAASVLTHRLPQGLFGALSYELASFVSHSALVLSIKIG